MRTFSFYNISFKDAYAIVTQISILEVIKYDLKIGNILMKEKTQRIY